LRQLRGAVSRDWADQCARVRSGRPLRFRITATALEEPGRATMLRGVLESGAVRPCDGVAVLHEGRGALRAWVRRVCQGGKEFRRLSAGQEPLEFDLVLSRALQGALVCGAVVASPEADAELEHRLSLSVDVLALSPRVRNVVRFRGCTTIGELVSFTELEFLANASFGETSLREIRDVLAALGLELGMRRT
jgi:hypothetical protein